MNDELIERLKEYVDYGTMMADDWKDNVRIQDLKDSITALQEMQGRIKELEGCMETPRLEDLERIAELEAIVNNPVYRIESLEAENKRLDAAFDHLADENKRLEEERNKIANSRQKLRGYLRDAKNKNKRLDAALAKTMRMMEDAEMLIPFELYEEVRKARAGECEHEWIDATNEVVKSGEICLKCNAVRAGIYTTEGIGGEVISHD